MLPKLADPDRLLAAGLSLLLFAVYAAGASSTIYVGDSGELVTAVYLLGIPHPTGYPLYVLLGKLWTIVLPLGSIAWRMSLFSAAAAGAACTVLFLAARQARMQRGPALVAALLLATAPSFWAEANVQRVYSLGALFVAAGAWTAFRWHQTRALRHLLALALLCGLGATNHTYMAVFAVAAALFAAVSEPRLLRRPGVLCAALCAFVSGLLPYLYLPWRSRFDPALDWGNPESLEAFLAVVTRRDFWARRWLDSPADLVVIGRDWLASVATELGLVGTLLALGACLLALRSRKGPTAFRALALLALLAAAGNLSVMALHGSRSDLFIWHRYYIPTYLFAALLAGAGLQAALTLLGRHRRLLGRILLALSSLLVAARFATEWKAQDRSRYRIAEDYSRRLLASLPPGADLAASDDNILFVLLYLHHVEGLRPDVRLLAQGVAEAHLPPLRFDPDESRLFFTHHPNWRQAELDVVPEGLAFHVVRRGTPPRVVDIGSRELDGENDPEVPKDYLTRNLIGEFHFMLGLGLEATDWTEALGEFERAATSAPDNDVLFYNLGLVYARNADLPRALAAFERSAAIQPRPLAGRPGVRASDRAAEIRLQMKASNPYSR